MMEKLVLLLLLLLTDNIFSLLREQQQQPQIVSICDVSLYGEGIKSPCKIGNEFNYNSPVGIAFNHKGSFSLLAEAKGVAGLGKAGGDGSGGSDKAGQQVPPEVYNALTYAGTAFLFTLSVPLILYSLNKLLNKIEDCFGCGPSSRPKKPVLPLEQSKQVARNITQHHQEIQNQLQQSSSKNLNQIYQQQTNSYTNNGNAPFSSLQQQQPQPVSNCKGPTPPLMPLNSTAITMAHEEPKLNYKTMAVLQQQNCQQPYIISSPNL